MTTPRFEKTQVTFWFSPDDSVTFYLDKPYSIKRRGNGSVLFYVGFNVWEVEHSISAESEKRLSRVVTEAIPRVFVHEGLDVYAFVENAYIAARASTPRGGFVSHVYTLHAKIVGVYDNPVSLCDFNGEEIPEPEETPKKVLVTKRGGHLPDFGDWKAGLR